MKFHNNTKGAIIIEGHVQGLSNTRSLGEDGIPVYVVDKNDCIARYSKHCLKFFKSPDFIEDDFVEFLVELAEKEKIQDWLILPSNDHAVYSLSKHKEKLEKYFKIITPNLDIVDNIYNKINLINIASSLGIPTPKTYTFSGEDNLFTIDLNFPVITKGCNGLSFYRALGKKVIKSNNHKELINNIDFIENKYFADKSFTQELIPYDGTNNTVSFTAFCDNGQIKTFWIGEKIREHPIRFGTATCAKSVYIEECHNQSISLLNVLNFTGVCEVEYLKDPRDGEYKLIEINPRTWLWVELARKCGVDYAKIIYDYVNGNNVTYPKHYKTNKYWINPFTDTFFGIKGIVTRKINFKDYYSSIFQTGTVNALFSKKDMLPGFMYLFNILAYMQNR